jgi:hypothetical protein
MSIDAKVFATGIYVTVRSLLCHRCVPPTFTACRVGIAEEHKKKEIAAKKLQRVSPLSTKG